MKAAFVFDLLVEKDEVSSSPEGVCHKSYHVLVYGSDDAGVSQ